MIETLIDWAGLIVMFALRVGIPLGVTYYIGRWLEKKFRPEEEVNGFRKAEMASRMGNPGKIIRLHCWDVRHDESTQNAQIAAAKHCDLPCWLALQTEGHALREQCTTCAFYKPNSVAA
jgi:hypothetical protein